VTGVQATFQNGLEGLFSPAVLHRRSEAGSGSVQTEPLQGSREARVYQFLLLQSRLGKLPVRFEVAGGAS